MTPTKAIALLDRQLDQHGQMIDLIRITGIPPNRTEFSVSVRAWVTGYEPKDLSPQILQGDSKVIISPTDLNNTEWPGEIVGYPVEDVRIPRRGDKVVIQGRERNVQSTSAPWYIQGVLVRLELQVRGQQ